MDYEIVDLDECVVSALKMFSKTELPRLELDFRKPLVVGSGNAAVTGRIIFEDREAVFADESTYQTKIEAVPDIDGALIISASGGKHAPVIAEHLKEKGKKVVLLTCNPDAPAKKFADDVHVSPKQTEPYTYNTSTYMGMILAKTKEDAGGILQFIEEKVKPLIPDNLKDYSAFYFIVPEELDAVRELFLTKFDELFGPMINGRVFTFEQTKHAKTVVPSDRELFVSFGVENNVFGTKRLNIPLPDNAGPAALMAVGYYFIGHIQKQNPPYFKQNIERYCEFASREFGQKITPIVE
ncbi:hypothetical protein D6764_00215 [Candidatus Woesearchaeota archaeon]|nr:MAG: hypothetical protein D6764_00215 [Candidatus Woesearchaeota archaeon]